MLRIDILLLFALCLLLAPLRAEKAVGGSLDIGLDGGSSRFLLQEELSEEAARLLREEDEFEREQAALRNAARVNAEREGEKIRLIEVAQREAVEFVETYRKTKVAKRSKLFLDLWKNGKGLIIRAVLRILEGNGELEEGTKVVIKAMEETEEAGFSLNVAEAVSSGITVVLEDGDADLIVDLLLIRMNKLNEESEGSGCDYINFLMADAEAFANSGSRELDIALAIDDAKYLKIAECVYDACGGKAAKCCGTKTALEKGSCQCGSGKRSRVCGFNLFHNMPRTIWICNTDDCYDGQKCLCPSEEKLASILKKMKDDQKKIKAKAKGKGKKKGKKTVKTVKPVDTAKPEKIAKIIKTAKKEKKKKKKKQQQQQQQKKAKKGKSFN